MAINYRSFDRESCLFSTSNSVAPRQIDLRSVFLTGVPTIRGHWRHPIERLLDLLRRRQDSKAQQRVEVPPWWAGSPAQCHGTPGTKASEWASNGQHPSKYPRAPG